MKKYVVAAALMCLSVAAVAWQGGMAAIGITEDGLQSTLERGTRLKEGQVTIPAIGAKPLAAARALSEPQQVAIIKELAAAARTIVMSPAFQSAHEAYIAKEHQAVNHGLKVKSEAEIAKSLSQGKVSDFELKMKRDMAAIYVQLAMETPIDNLKTMFDYELEEWTKSAARAKGANVAKYKKLVSQGQALRELSATDEAKFRRGYAVLKSADAGGPDTEEALFGASADASKENEQRMWDQHNLRGTLKRVLSQVVAEAPTVDFAAQTVQKDGSQVFVNPAYEKKSLTWKAMYRAGKGPTAAGIEVAKAWLKELQ